MKFDSGRSWLWAAMVVFAVIIVIWVVAALQLNSASAGGLPFFGARANLSADYGSGDQEGGGLLGFLSLSVLADAFRDEGLTDEEAEEQAQALQDELEGNVPTATALNFSGDSPFTATPTFTPVPSSTPLPTETNTPVPVSTLDPTATKTEVPAAPKPSKTPTPGGSPSATPDPTATSSSDNDEPIIVGGASFSPPPPDLAEHANCVITVSGQQVLDPAPSSGMDRVRLKYTGPGISGYIFSSDLIPVGGFSGGGWDATYSGSVDLSGSGLKEDDKIELYVKAEDNAGNESFLFIDNWVLDEDC